MTMVRYEMMIDYGKAYPNKQGPSGYEAIVRPEDTLRDIIEAVAGLWPINPNAHNSILFVHLHEGTETTDVTESITAAAEKYARAFAEG
jgi:hypothetical protein